MGAYSRNKGKRSELELCHLLSDYLGVKLNRNYKQVAEAQHGDIEQLVGPYLVESKNCATITLAPWWKQASDAARAKGAQPCVAYRLGNRKAEDRWRFVVPLPQVWALGVDWRWDLRYSVELGIEGFAFLCRERGN